MNIDTQRVKESIDCRLLIEADLGPAARRNGKWAMWKCPFHLDDTPSFGVTAASFYCFGCQATGDAFTWLQRRQGLDFPTAAQRLIEMAGLGYTLGVPAQPPPPPPHLTIAVPPDHDWQMAARAVVEEAEANLWGPDGERPRNYLAARGLTRFTARCAFLGWIPGAPGTWVRMHDLDMPAGIVIPWLEGENIWGIKVRRSAGNPKYVQPSPSGGALGRALYMADNLPDTPGRVLVIEGEFNAMIASQVWENEPFSVVSVGSASSRLNAYWLARLAPHRLIVIADRDRAGSELMQRFQAFGRRVGFVRIPEPVKDLNELFLLPGSQPLMDAVLEQIVNA